VRDWPLGLDEPAKWHVTEQLLPSERLPPVPSPYDMLITRGPVALKLVGEWQQGEGDGGQEPSVESISPRKI
jgi:hypothetical protein